MKVIYYTDRQGKIPFLNWFDKLKDNKRKNYIMGRLLRIQNDNLGDYKPITKTSGLFELRFHNDGTRIYFTKHKNIIVILFCAGNKDTQKKDIAKAKKYYMEYKTVEGIYEQKSK